MSKWKCCISPERAEKFGRKFANEVSNWDCTVEASSEDEARRTAFNNEDCPFPPMQDFDPNSDALEYWGKIALSAFVRTISNALTIKTCI